MAEMVSKANEADCDIVEIRLDLLKAADISRLSEIRHPVIATCMPEWEGGRFTGSEEERADILCRAIPLASHVSLELATDDELRKKVMDCARGAGVKVILSHHDFESTPETGEIVSTLRAQQKEGADIAKVAYQPKTCSDALRVLLAKEEAALDIPVIALAMGSIGAFTRVAGPMLGAYLTFAAAASDEGTAPGQYGLEKMNAAKKLFWGD